MVSERGPGERESESRGGGGRSQNSHLITRTVSPVG